MFSFFLLYIDGRNIAGGRAICRTRKVTELLLLPIVGGARDQSLFRDASAHQRHEPAAAGDFEFTEDRVKVLFHRRQTQAGVISDFFVALPSADELRNFLFPPGKSDELRQTRACWASSLSKVTPQIFALNKKMRPRQAN